MTLSESPSKVVVEAQDQSGSNTTSGFFSLFSSQSTPKSGVLYSGRDHDTLAPGSFDHYVFELTNAAVLDYTVDVLTDGSVNVILTTQDELERFEYRADIRMLDKGSEFATTKAEIRARINPANYTIIVDNTGRLEGTEGDKSSDFEIEYEVKP